MTKPRRKKKVEKYKNFTKGILKDKDFKINESMLEGRKSEDIRAEQEESRKAKRLKKIQEMSKKVKEEEKK